MSTNVSFNGSIYSIPADGDEDWGAEVSSYLQAIATGTLQRSGGTFTLASEIDFGATFGLKVSYLKSRATNPSGVGQVRLGNNESVSWRNAANTADLGLTVDGTNALVFAGTSITVGGTPVQTAITVTDSATIDLTLTILNDLSAIVKAASLDDSHISGSAAIAVSKLAAMTVSRAVVSDGSGHISAASVTATELGYLSGATSSVQTQLNAKQGTITQLPIANGGTGQATKTAGFDALSPMTAAGDLILGGVSGSAGRLGVGAEGDQLQVIAGAPVWAAAVAGEITGFVKDYLGSSAPTGYVFGSGRTIGSAGSGATERANADTINLYTLLWNDYSNSIFQIQTSAGAGTTRGASAAADFAANKRMPLPDLRSVLTLGKDNMGGSAANRVTTAGSGIDAVTLGATGGAQNVTLTSAEMPVHTHIQNAHNHTITDPGHVHPMLNTANTANLTGSANSIRSTGAANTSSAVTGITIDNATAVNQNAGSGGAHNNMPPVFVLNKVIKL